MTLRIGSRLVGPSEKPFIIAEMSGNHNQSLDRALSIVDQAAKAGASAIKLQTYTPDTLTLNVQGGEFDISNQDSLWRGKNLYELYSEAYTPWDWHEPIMNRARELGLECFSSPFDETAVDFLEELNVPAYKIASFENNHLPLIEKAASTGKPLIISTGMATLAELDRAVSIARSSGCSDLVLLKCTSTYPASPKNTNIRTIPHLSELFRCQVGLSDHTMGIGTAIAAIALGATIVEKHFTLSRSEGGVDSAFSLEPAELRELVLESQRSWEALGAVKYGPTAAEKDSLIFRRSIYAASDIAKGGVLTSSNTKIVRPGGGAPPYLYQYALGSRASKDFKKGDPIRMEDLFH